jgi:hypothetical protein
LKCKYDILGNIYCTEQDPREGKVLFFLDNALF